MDPDHSAADAVTDVLTRVDDWPVDTVAVGVTSTRDLLATRGPVDRVFELASVTKPLTGLGVLLAAQFGDVHLDEPAGPDGSTVRHLLAHASGLGAGADDRRVAPGTRRVYSNAGYELLGDLVAERTGSSFAEHLEHEVCAPLGLTDTVLPGSPASGARSTVTDLLAVARALLAPGLLDADGFDDLARPQWPDLDGIVPGYGRHRPCPWGLGVEIRGDKQPHWTGPHQPATVFGHFGQTGTFLWVDRTRDVAAVVLTDRAFGAWAKEAWGPFNDALSHATGAA